MCDILLSRNALHLHQEALVIVSKAAVGLQQTLEMLPQPRSLLSVLWTQSSNKQHSCSDVVLNCVVS